jgi:hypothetical protein
MENPFHESVTLIAKMKQISEDTKVKLINLVVTTGFIVFDDEIIEKTDNGWKSTSEICYDCDDVNEVQYDFIILPTGERHIHGQYFRTSRTTPEDYYYEAEYENNVLVWYQFRIGTYLEMGEYKDGSISYIEAALGEFRIVREFDNGFLEHQLYTKNELVLEDSYFKHGIPDDKLTQLMGDIFSEESDEFSSSSESESFSDYAIQLEERIENLINKIENMEQENEKLQNRLDEIKNLGAPEEVGVLETAAQVRNLAFVKFKNHVLESIEHSCQNGLLSIYVSPTLPYKCLSWLKDYATYGNFQLELSSSNTYKLIWNAPLF